MHFQLPLERVNLLLESLFLVRQRLYAVRDTLQLRESAVHVVAKSNQITGRRCPCQDIGFTLVCGTEITVRN